MFSSGQLLAFDFHGFNLKAAVMSVSNFDPSALGAKKSDSSACLLHSMSATSEMALSPNVSLSLSLDVSQGIHLKGCVHCQV